MKSKITTLAAMALLTGSTAFSNTPVILNTTFDGYPAASAFEGWAFPANRFELKSGVMTYIETLTIRNDSYSTFAERVAPSGNGWAFNNWDDEAADRIETYMVWEENAGPPGDFANELFQTGDTLVFKGKAMHVKSNPSVVARAFIKFLGYNELGWAFQTKDISVFYNTTTTMEAFELRATFPDLEADDSYQVVQWGFEISGEFDGSFGTGTITFEDIEGYIEGAAAPQWNGFDVDENGWADTGAWMGMVNVAADPWIWVHDLTKYLYIPTEGTGNDGAWVYAVAQ